MNMQPDFTIKQILTMRREVGDTRGPEFDTFEHLWPAVGQVWKTPQLVDMKPAVRFTGPDGVQGSIDQGIVYVVNAGGKTVATYDFQNVPVPS